MIKIKKYFEVEPLRPLGMVIGGFALWIIGEIVDLFVFHRPTIYVWGCLAGIMIGGIIGHFMQKRQDNKIKVLINGGLQ
jgi:hypothetical protein